MPCSVLRFVRAQTCSDTSSHSFSRGRGTGVRCDQTYGLDPPHRNEFLREGRIPGSMKRHGWDGWIGVRYPDRAIPTKPSCHSWRTTPNYISSTGSRGALGRQGSLCYGRFATGEDSWACTEFGLCEQPSSPHIMLPPRESCFATLPLTAYPKFRCIQGSCASVPNIFARATPFVRGRSTNLGFARLPSAPNQAKQA